MSRAVVDVAEPDDLGLDAVRAVAAGAGVRLDEGLRERVAVRRAQVLAVLASGDTVYGVTTGMGAQSDHRLEHDAQEAHSERLLLARAVGGPPWFDAPEVRALVAARLRTFLSGDAGVSVELCDWLVEQLDGGVVAAVPRTGSGGAGEIIPLAHAWGQLAGVGRVLGADGRAGPAPRPDARAAAARPQGGHRAARRRPRRDRAGGAAHRGDPHAGPAVEPGGRGRDRARGRLARPLQRGDGAW